MFRGRAVTSKIRFGAKKCIFWTNFITSAFGPKIKLNHFSNVLLYTEHENNKIKAKKIYTGGVIMTSKMQFGPKNAVSKTRWKIPVFGTKILFMIFLSYI